MKPETFREIRTALGLTQQQLADKAHIRGGGRVVRRYEAGESIPGPLAVLMRTWSEGDRHDPGDTPPA